MGMKRLGIISAVILFVWILGLSFAWGGENTPYSCFATSDTIRIDGRLDEPADRAVRESGSSGEGAGATGSSPGCRKPLGWDPCEGTLAGVV